MVAAYTFWERDEAAKLIADVAGVVRAANDSKELLAKAEVIGSGDATAAVEELAATDPSIGADSKFIDKVKLASTLSDGREYLEAATASRIACHDDVAEVGPPILVTWPALVRRRKFFWPPARRQHTPSQDCLSSSPNNLNTGPRETLPTPRSPADVAGAGAKKCRPSCFPLDTKGRRKHSSFTILIQSVGGNQVGRAIQKLDEGALTD